MCCVKLKLRRAEHGVLRPLSSPSVWSYDRWVLSLLPQTLNLVSCARGSTSAHIRTPKRASAELQWRWWVAAGRSLRELRWQVPKEELERAEADGEDTQQPSRSSRYWRCCSPAASGTRRAPSRATSFSCSLTIRMFCLGGWWVHAPGKRMIINCIGDISHFDALWMIQTNCKV